MCEIIAFLLSLTPFVNKKQRANKLHLSNYFDLSYTKGFTGSNQITDCMFPLIKIRYNYLFPTSPRSGHRNEGFAITKRRKPFKITEWNAILLFKLTA